MRTMQPHDRLLAWVMSADRARQLETFDTVFQADAGLNCALSIYKTMRGKTVGTAPLEDDTRAHPVEPVAEEASAPNVNV